MAYRVVVTPAVARSLEGAVAYIVDVLCSPQAATNLANAFEGTVTSLENNPTFYAKDFYASRLFKTEIYKRQIGNYVIYYFIQGDTVVVFAFLHGRQDKRTHLRSFYDEM